MAKKVASKTNKKEIKKNNKKIEAEKVSIKKIEEEPKKVEKKGINKNTMAILYLLCSICWLVSGVMEVKAKTSGVLSFVVGGLLLLLAIFYFYKDSKQK